MIAGLVMATVMLLAVGAHPPPKETSPPTPDRVGPVLFPGEGRDMKAAASEVRPSYAAIDEKITCKESCPTHCRSLGQEGMCLQGVCHCQELKCEYDESCSSHCLTLGHSESHCHEGICRCGVISSKRDKRPTIKCSELVSTGEKRRSHDELCLTHCRTLREGYRRGECQKGICHCSM